VKDLMDYEVLEFSIGMIAGIIKAGINKHG
jgi:hypothetical protein